MRRLPVHIAIIMDGNGRWAKKQGLENTDGHKQGVKTIIDIVRYCGEIGISYLTLYAWSSENWRRPQVEVDTLMRLLYEYLTRECDELVEKGVSVSSIGDTEKLPLDVKFALQEVRNKTAQGKKMHVNLALSYGARDEIVRATRLISEEVSAGRLRASDIDEDLFSSYLDTRNVPDPDLFIRTSGEMRLSNFLLWQMSYTELYVIQKNWPDFTRADMDTALEEFSKRQRRFGMTVEQVSLR